MQISFTLCLSHTVDVETNHTAKSLLCILSILFPNLLYTGGDGYGTFSDDDIAGLRSEASQRELARSNPRFIEEHEKPFHLPWFTKIMIAIAVLGFMVVGTCLLSAFFSGHLGMMSVTRGDLAKLAAVSGVPGVKHSHLLKAALGQAKDPDADLSLYGTRLPKARIATPIYALPKKINLVGKIDHMFGEKGHHKNSKPSSAHEPSSHDSK